jgi:hypothetical protein
MFARIAQTQDPEQKYFSGPITKRTISLLQKEKATTLKVLSAGGFTIEALFLLLVRLIVPRTFTLVGPNVVCARQIF